MTPSPTSEPPRGGAVLALCFCIVATEGYDLQAIAVAATRPRDEFSIPAEAPGWIFSAGTFGLLIGASLGGRGLKVENSMSAVAVSPKLVRMLEPFCERRSWS